MSSIGSKNEEAIRNLTKEICENVDHSPLILEEKLAAVMMVCFEILSAIPANEIRMHVSDGQILCLQLKQPETTTH
ncbi:hypothetical protein RHD99_01035 [Buttiauxella selenatireducens]|uniref:Uncharacterized protein n=1 Tax=Buttiauxella selenatireducens TaxID=3073902 RepID=A0ABY9SDT0_9ENTR|nr:hypothetical protein [Buttiauxella sp. R73]WMY74601.1 hypothetical protein RHD99_01035 [Buttiauxella sp. R73]